MQAASSSGQFQSSAEQLRNRDVTVEELACFADEELSAAAAASTRIELHLIGKVVMVRSFVTPRGMQAQSQSQPYFRKMTYVTLADAEGRSILVVYFASGTAPDASHNVGRVLHLGPVDIKERDPVFDGSKNAFTAYARTMAKDKKTVFRDLTDMANSDSRIREIRDSNKYFPAITRLRSAGIDERHGFIPVVLKRVLRTPPDSDTLDLEVADDDGSAAIASIDAKPHRAFAGTDVYSLDVRADMSVGGGVKEAFVTPGTILILSDFRSDAHYSNPNDDGLFTRVHKLLVSTPTSRIHVARNPAITKQLVPLAERVVREEKERDDELSCPIDEAALFVVDGADYVNDDSRMMMLKSYIPSLYDVLDRVHGNNTTIVCVLDGIVPSYTADLTRMRCPNDYYKHNRFETCDPSIPGLFCTECGNLTKANRHFDASVLVRERVTLLGGGNEDAFVVLKVSGPCVAKSFFGNISADEFEELSQDEKAAIINRRVGRGRVAVLRVWCKPEGNKIVMDAHLLAARVDDSFDGKLNKICMSSFDTSRDNGSTKKARLENVSTFEF